MPLKLKKEDVYIAIVPSVGLIILLTLKDRSLSDAIFIVSQFIISFVIIRVQTADKVGGYEQVEDPIRYVRFIDGNICFGSTSVPIKNIRKLALEAVATKCYFSLPYNQTAPGKVPCVEFPIEKLEAFESYLLCQLPNVEIIR